jgi:hypothetical protein
LQLKIFFLLRFSNQGEIRLYPRSKYVLALADAPDIQLSRRLPIMTASVTIPRHRYTFFDDSASPIKVNAAQSMGLGYFFIVVSIAERKAVALSESRSRF